MGNLSISLDYYFNLLDEGMPYPIRVRGRGLVCRERPKLWAERM